MSDFQLVDPKGWECDLHSVYSAWIGHFQIQCIPWYEKSWGHLFGSFSDFLEFGWPAIVVTDSVTGKAHIVTRQSSIEAFVKMIKTRFGEVLPLPPNSLVIVPFETSNRPLRKISDFTSYKKLCSTLAPAELSALKTRVKEGNVEEIRKLWNSRQKTWLSMDFEWSERNEKSILEWGYAAVRCSFLERQKQWPPNPDVNYRKGHYVLSEYTDVINRHCPNYPWEYAFGDTQIIRKANLPLIIEAIIGSLATPESETTSNELVLLGHGLLGDIKRLEEMSIKIPRNVLVVDTALFERALFADGLRGPMFSPKDPSKPRSTKHTLSLENMLFSLALLPTPPPHTLPLPPNGMIRIPALPGCKLHNAGNDAFLSLFALQKLIDPLSVGLPSVKRRIGFRPTLALPAIPFPPSQPHPPRHSMMGYIPGSSNAMMAPSPIAISSPMEFGTLGPPVQHRILSRSMSTLPILKDEQVKDKERERTSSIGVNKLGTVFSNTLRI